MKRFLALTVAVLGFGISSALAETPVRWKPDCGDIKACETQCSGGDLESCYDIALSYGRGYGVPKDAKRAMRSFADLCSKGHAASCAFMGDMAEAWTKDLPLSARYRTQACDLGHADACNLLGVFYSNGEGVPRSDADAIHIWDRACALGHEVACNNIGGRYLDGRGVRRDEVIARRYFERGCELKDGHACERLGNLMTKMRERHSALVAYEKGCVAGYADACERVLLMGGKPHSAPSWEAEVRRRRDECHAGFALGCSKLAGLYAQGKGVRRDAIRAFKLWEHACVKNYPPACHEVGLARLSGAGVTRDPARATEAFRHACELSWPAACVEFGMLQESHAPTDAARAYERACEAAVPHGCHRSALLFEEGRGVPRDAGHARQLYREACRLGSRESCRKSQRGAEADGSHYGSP